MYKKKWNLQWRQHVTNRCLQELVTCGGKGRYSFALVVLLILGGWIHSSANAQSCSQTPSGLISWWPGDGSFADIQGHNDGTNAGAVTFAPGKIAEGFHFDASPTSYIILPNTTSLSPTTQITVEAWIKPDFSFTSGSDVIINKRDGCGVNRSYHLSVTHQPYGSLQGTLPPPTIVWSSSVASDDVYPATLFPDDGQFHHLAGTYDGAWMNVYLDGQLVGTKAHSGNIMTTSDPPSIGLQVGCPDVGAHATIDEVKLYSRALTQDEIQTIAMVGAAGQCKNNAFVQQPINSDGSSVFRVKRGVVPVKFSLTRNQIATCDLPAATVALTRTAGAVVGTIDESVYLSPSDVGSNFRIDSAACQYVYNLDSSSLGVGEYRVDILINGNVVGSGVFGLQ
jgi:hypothetical protein